MKKTIMRVLSVFLSLLIVISIVPLGALAQTTDSNGIPYAEFDGHYYRAFDVSVTWEEAKEYCESMKGYLVTITSAKEQNVITDLIQSNEKLMFWIGLQKTNNAWSWVNDENVIFTNWADYEPNNEDNVEYYGSCFREEYTNGQGTKSPGEWNDASNEGASYASQYYELTNYGFICEWDEEEYFFFENNMRESKWSDLTHVSYDWILDDNSSNVLVEVSGTLENTKYVNIGTDQTAVFFGWAAAAKKIKGFAYSVDGGKLIYDESFKDDAEQAVLDVANGMVTNDGRYCVDAKRFKVPVPTKKGEYIARIYVVYEDGTAELFWTCVVDKTATKPTIQDTYLKQHISFVKSQTYNTATTDYRFAEILWENCHDGAAKNTLELVYDVLEGTFEVLSFKAIFAGELTSCENPYDAILLDLLSSSDVEDSLTDVMEEITTSIAYEFKDALITTFQANNKWSEDDMVGNLKGFLELEPEDYSSNEFYKYLDEELNGMATKEINLLFKEYAWFDKLFSEVGDFASGVDYFLGMFKYVASIEAYYNASAEFKAVLKEVSDTMPQVHEGFSDRFKETYDNYSACVDYDSALQSVLKHAGKEGIVLVSGYMTEFLQDTALKFCKTALKMSEKAAGALVAILWAADTGFQLGNLITNNDDVMECRRLLRANHALDKAVYYVMNEHANNLKSNPSYTEALYFDAAFGLFKNLQLHSINCHKRILEKNSSSFLNYILGKQDKFKREAEAQAVIIDTWKKIKCHDDSATGGILYSGPSTYSNTVVVACPTDVYVYRKSDGELVASVVNNVVYCIDDALTVVAESNDKAICVPNLDDYDIQIVATDEGSMTVEYNVSTPERTYCEREVQFNNVELSTESSFALQSDADNGLSLVDQSEEIILPDIDTGNLAFKGVSLTLHDNLAVNYKVDADLFDGGEYTEPYVIFELNGVETKVDEYTVANGRYVFTFRNLSPNKMNDTIRATLYAKCDGKEYASVTKEYSVAEYCYSMLELYSDDSYAELRTLIVDLLNYGAESQTYTGYDTENLANSELAASQKLWATNTVSDIKNILDTKYETVEQPTATWRGAGLILTESIVMKLKFKTESIENLSVKIRTESKEWTINADEFIKDGDVYYVLFSGLNAGQMSEAIYMTIYDGETAVSNTARYSIESYVYEAQNSTDENLSSLVTYMIKYGKSAYAYAN